MISSEAFLPSYGFNFRELLIVSLTFLSVGHCCVVDWENRERPMFHLYQCFVTSSWLYFFSFSGEVENTWYIEVDFLSNLKWYPEMFYGQKPAGHCVEKPAELFLKIFFFSLKKYHAVFKQPQLFFILIILMILHLSARWITLCL